MLTIALGCPCRGRIVRWSTLGDGMGRGFTDMLRSAALGPDLNVGGAASRKDRFRTSWHATLPGPRCSGGPVVIDRTRLAL
jgi:hypothetical protein